MVSHFSLPGQYPHLERIFVIGSGSRDGDEDFPGACLDSVVHEFRDSAGRAPATNLRPLSSD